MAVAAEEQIIQLLEAELAKVTTVNGYQTDVGADRVHRWSPSLGVRGAGARIYLEIAGSRQAPERLRLSQTEARQLDVILDLQLSAATDADLRLSNFLADVYQTLTDDPQLGSTVLDLEVGDVYRALTGGEQGLVEARALMEVSVFFRHVWADPFTVSPPSS